MLHFKVMKSGGYISVNKCTNCKSPPIQLVILKEGYDLWISVWFMAQPFRVNIPIFLFTN